MGRGCAHYTHTQLPSIKSVSAGSSTLTRSAQHSPSWKPRYLHRRRSTSICSAHKCATREHARQAHSSCSNPHHSCCAIFFHEATLGVCLQPRPGTSSQHHMLPAFCTATPHHMRSTLCWWPPAAAGCRCGRPSQTLQRVRMHSSKHHIRLVNNSRTWGYFLVTYICHTPTIP
jgi:hypothetical protein